MPDDATPTGNNNNNNFDPKAFTAALTDALSKVKIEAAPVKAGNPWDDPKYWLVGGEDVPAEEQARQLHGRIEQFVDHKVNQKDKKIKELEDEVQKHRAAFDYFDVAKQNDPKFTESKDAVKKIMDEEGVNYKVACRIYNAEKAGQAAPTAPPKPFPGAAASAPTNTTTAKEERKSYGTGVTRIREIINEGIADGKIKF